MLFICTGTQKGNNICQKSCQGFYENYFCCEYIKHCSYILIIEHGCNSLKYTLTSNQLDTKAGVYQLYTDSHIATHTQRKALYYLLNNGANIEEKKTHNI